VRFDHTFDWKRMLFGVRWVTGGDVIWGFRYYFQVFFGPLSLQFHWGAE